MRRGITINDWITVIAAVAVSIFGTGALYGDRGVVCRTGGIISLAVLFAAVGWWIGAEITRGRRGR